jgi:hypothetical protein
MRNFLVLLPLLTGCLNQVVPIHSQAESVPSDSMVQQILATQSYKGPDFVRVNKDPYKSGIVEADPVFVNVYVTAGDAPEYEAEDPGVKKTNMTVPAGMVVVREVQDSGGTTQKLTVMVRHEDGWFPNGGDFLYGVTDLQGHPIPDSSGTAQWGQLSACTPCHLGREGDAWVFGVPAAVR